MPEQNEAKRAAIIRFRAKADVPEYLKLMRERQPDFPELMPDGQVIINLSDGEDFFERIKAEAGFSDAELREYVVDMAEEIKKLLTN